MTEVGGVHVCKICGNKIKVLVAGKETLVCCGKPMVLGKMVFRYADQQFEAVQVLGCIFSF